MVQRPAGAALHVPPGFEVEQFAAGLDGRARCASHRTAMCSSRKALPAGCAFCGRAAAIQAATTVFAEGLTYPFGIAFWPPGPAPRFVYVAETDRVVRFPYRAGDLRPRGKPDIVVPHLPTGGHATRDLVFSRDGRTMFVVGRLGRATSAPVARRNVPTCWRSMPMAATGASSPPACATAPREAIAPATGALWCVVNERDGLGDDLPPDYATSVREGAFYGWPWYYIGDHEDPRLKGQRPDLAGHVTLPDVLIQPHSAPLGIAFYDGAQFPQEYRGDAFVTLRGSWNRARRTGYKVVRLRFANGRPTGEYQDFLTGFVASDQAVWGRPVGIAVAHDGALLVSEDGNGTIWRIAYREGNR